MDTAARINPDALKQAREMVEFAEGHGTAGPEPHVNRLTLARALLAAYAEIEELRAIANSEAR